MKRFLFYFAVIFLTLIISLYVYLGLTNNPKQFWLRQSNVKVIVNEEVNLDASVYRHPDGKLLVEVERNLYLYIPEQRNIGLCNSMRSVTLPFYTYFFDWNEKSYPCVMFNKVKIDVDAELVEEPNALEFNNIERRRVRVVW
jgi:hypothetical protein